MNKILIFVLGTLLLSGCTSKDVLIEVGKNEVTKDELYKEMKISYGEKVAMSILRKELEEELFLSKYKTKDENLKNILNHMKKEFNVNSIDDIKMNLNITEEELMRRARVVDASYQFLLEETGVTEEELLPIYEANKNTVTYKYFMTENKKSVKSIKLNVDKGSDLESSVQSYDAKLAESIMWEVVKGNSNFLISGDILNSLNDLQVSQTSDVIEENGMYYIFEVVEINDLSFEETKYEILDTVLSQKEINKHELYSKAIKNVKINFKDEELSSFTNEQILNLLSQ